MPRPAVKPLPIAAWPPEPDPEMLPHYADRARLAQIHTHYYGPLSARTLEAWPLEWRRVNGRAVCSVSAFLAEAQRRFEESPVIRGGRNSANQKVA